MEMMNILVFAILGAVAFFIVSGGLASMMDMDATPTVLGGGAVIGAALGGATGWLTGEGGAEAAASVLPKSIATAMKGGFGGGGEELKVGLPAF